MLYRETLGSIDNREPMQVSMESDPVPLLDLVQTLAVNL